MEALEAEVFTLPIKAGIQSPIDVLQKRIIGTGRLTR